MGLRRLEQLASPGTIIQLLSRTMAITYWRCEPVGDFYSRYTRTGDDVVVNASCSGVYCARLVSRHAPKAAIGVDCGIGKDGAGIADVELGNGEDLYRSGKISRVNELARLIGVEEGMPVREAALIMLDVSDKPVPEEQGVDRLVVETSPEGRSVVCVDSIADASPEDYEKNVLCTAGHTGRSVIGSFSAELAAGADLDYVVVDQQHGIVGYDSMVPMLQAIEAAGATPITRVLSSDPFLIMKPLDAGAWGVIVPLVNDAEEVARAVAACRCPPHGMRSWGSTRASAALGSNDPKELAGEVLCLVMVETREGVENVEEIAATPGLDGIYVRGRRTWRSL
jgi:hypothetical protein